ncbi:MAG: hypothetical protein MUF08_03255 [Burkholderiaceae bacterium]|jgi:hypothetical protein|nr:hypothetical protein [Burkholderiaceae bacterium]
MPYYVYRVGPFAQLLKLAQFDAFRPALAHAKALRAVPDQPAQTRIKIMFAASETLAEELLCQVREAGPSGDE